MGFVVMRRDRRLRVRSRLLLVRHHPCRNPTQGQQHRQQHENEDSKRLHGFEASTIAEVTSGVAGLASTTHADSFALTLRVQSGFRSHATIGEPC